jgi:hypothetical protein
MKKIFFIAAFASATIVQAQNVSSQVKLSKGQVLEQLSEVKATMSQEMMGQTMEFVIETKGTSQFDVKEATASSYTIASTTKRIQMNMSGMGQEQQFDTDKKEDMEGPMGAGFRDRVNKTKEYTVDTKGIITSIKDTSGKKEDVSGMAGMMTTLSQAVEKEGARFMLFANIPPKGVKLGDTWVDSVSIGDGATKTISTYTLKSLNGNQGTISVSSATTMEQDIEQGSMAMHMSMKGNTTGEYLFETGSGLISGATATTKATGTIEVMGQTVPMTVENTVKTTLNKK